MQADKSHRKSDGFSLIELLIVIVILGILATVVVFSVRGVTDRGQDSACDTDARTLAVAVEAYFAQEQTGGLIPGSGGPQQYEQTLIDAGLVRDFSDYWDVAEDGDLIPVTPC